MFGFGILKFEVSMTERLTTYDVSWRLGTVFGYLKSSKKYLVDGRNPTKPTCYIYIYDILWKHGSFYILTGARHLPS